MAKHAGWENLNSLTDFLRNQGLWKADAIKPPRPKEAFELLLREKRIQRSSAIYEKIAMDAGFRDCTDPAFLKFKTVLAEWFHTHNQ
jgi:hypothetical protein